MLKRTISIQKNRLIETVLLSTHNIRFGSEIRKIIFQYALLSGGLVPCQVLEKSTADGMARLKMLTSHVVVMYELSQTSHGANTLFLLNLEKKVFEPSKLVKVTKKELNLYFELI